MYFTYGILMLVIEEISFIGSQIDIALFYSTHYTQSKELHVGLQGVNALARLAR